MGLTALIALISLLGLVTPVANTRVIDAALVCAFGLAALACLLVARGQAAVREALGRHWLIALLYLCFLGWLAARALQSPDPGTALARAEMSFLVFTGLGVAALCSAAAARRQGPSDAVNVYLVLGTAAGVATLVLAAFVPGGTAAPVGLAGVSVLAAFAALEAYRRANRAAAQAQEAPPLARRLFLPVAASVASAVGLAASQDGFAVLAACAGIVAMSLVYAVRLRAGQRPAAGMATAAILAATGALYGLVRALTGGGGDDGASSAYAQGASLTLWQADAARGLGLEALAGDPILAAAPAGVRLLAETGLVGVGLATATAAAAALAIALTKDRDRVPSRGGALCAGLLACAGASAVTSPALTQAAPAFVLACLFGLSAAYGDRPRSHAPSAAKAGRPSAQVGMQRL